MTNYKPRAINWISSELAATSLLGFPECLSVEHRNESEWIDVGFVLCCVVLEVNSSFPFLNWMWEMDSHTRTHTYLLASFLSDCTLWRNNKTSMANSCELSLKIYRSFGRKLPSTQPIWSIRSAAGGTCKEFWPGQLIKAGDSGTAK